MQDYIVDIRKFGLTSPLHVLVLKGGIKGWVKEFEGAMVEALGGEVKRRFDRSTLLKFIRIGKSNTYERTKSNLEMGIETHLPIRPPHINQQERPRFWLDIHVVEHFHDFICCDFGGICTRRWESNPPLIWLRDLRLSF